MRLQKEKKFRKVLSHVVLVCSAIVLLAVGRTDNSAHAAGLLIADGGFGGTLEIIEQDVEVTINNGIAVTEVTQVFKNMENRQVEALYTFPVPKGASVSNFSMWIGGKEMVGEVLEKQRAREIYNSYKQQRRDPGLLEQVDYKTFEMRIFPIAPKAEQRVQITYYQELDFDHDWATYVYPLATTTRTQADNQVRGRFSVSANIKSAIPIVSVKSPSHDSDFVMIDHSSNYHEASLEKRDGDLARDVVLAYQISRPVTGLDLITSKTGNEDGYFALTLTAGKELEKIQTGADYVFILDISGSMATEGKLNTSVNSLQAFIKNLNSEDRFEVITFNKTPNTLFNQLTKVEQESIAKAVSFLNSQEARGGTSLQPAMATAYKYGTADRPLNAVILSDGMTEQTERRVLMEMLQSRPANTRIFCIGVGNEINRSLLRQLAEDAGGLAAFLSLQDDFERQAKAFQRKLMHPVATNLQIDVSGIDVYDLEPKKLPNLYHGVPVRLYGRYKGKGNGRIHISGEVNGRQIATDAELVFADKNDDNPEIERMWAWHKMERLKREHEMNNDPTLVDEIVRLGEGYSITSEFTSFLVLENDAEYQRWKIERRNASRIERDRKAQQRLRQELEELRKKSMGAIGPTDIENTTPDNGTPLVAKAPVPAQPVQQPRTQPSSESRSMPTSGFDTPSFGGGGAMDPVSALVGVVLGGAALLGRRKKK
jgi:Ca-activated chloride channel family protein